MSNPVAKGVLLPVLIEESGINQLFGQPKTNTLIAFIRKNLNLSGYDAATIFKANSYGDCIDHTRAAKEFLDQSGLTKTIWMEGRSLSVVPGQVDDLTYALLVGDLLTDSWWFWKASPKTCEALANMPRLPIAYPPEKWNSSTTSTIILQMSRYNASICALQLIDPSSINLDPTEFPTIVMKSSSRANTFSKINDQPQPSTDVKVEWESKKVKFVLTIYPPPSISSDLTTQSPSWDESNPPQISIDLIENNKQTTAKFKITNKQDNIYRLESIQNDQFSVIYVQKFSIPNNEPYVENAPPEFTALMWLCYSPMVPNNLEECISAWWKQELDAKPASHVAK